MEKARQHTALTFVAALAATAAGAKPGAEPVMLPAGLTVELDQTLWDSSSGSGLWLRLRFVTVPEGAPLAVAEGDLAALCTLFGLPLAGERAPERIVVSVSDRRIAFGTTEPSVAQVFDMFRPEDGTCIWEPF